ncbi:MAG: carbamoyl transferase, partial [Candidatus Woesearchaeota archaeon]|nr:carbamoyl transferase [Candidatus Woesearchaeota archaeon]
GLKDWFVFPHMGDGGLALGAAMQVNFELNSVSRYDFSSIYFGTEYSDEEIESELKAGKVKYSKRDGIEKEVGDLISNDKIVMWFQGRMEYGPRALGNRSIVASASKKDVKDTLNIMLKRRDWFQPFCPSVLEEEAHKFFKDVGRFDRFMTMGYMTRENARKGLEAVMNVDNSVRPQMLGAENQLYRRMIEQVKKNTGDGIILNTSFNIHGFPIVMTPKDAISSFKTTKAGYLAIGNFLAKQ